VSAVRGAADDEAALSSYARDLADAVEAALPKWVRRSVERFLPLTGDLADEVDAAGRRTQERIGGQVRELLMTDIDEQTRTPLTLLRRAVREPTEILRAHGVAPVPRDDFEEHSFPDDVYALTPATFADIDPSLAEPGLRWGAAKAFVFKQRRRAEGKR
jgi:hypothetical protein